MDFSENITWYYTAESKHALINSTAMGSIVLLIGFALIIAYNSSELARGISIALIIGSLIFILGGYFSGSATKKSMPQKIEEYQSNPKNFINNEFQNVERIHNNWFGIRIFWTMFLLVAVAMLFLVTKPFWSGIAVGILIIGTLGQIEEVISYQHNEKYRLEVQQERDNIKNDL